MDNQLSVAGREGNTTICVIDHGLMTAVYIGDESEGRGHTVVIRTDAFCALLDLADEYLWKKNQRVGRQSILEEIESALEEPKREDIADLLYDLLRKSRQG